MRGERGGGGLLSYYLGIESAPWSHVVLPAIQDAGSRIILPIGQVSQPRLPGVCHAQVVEQRVTLGPVGLQRSHAKLGP